MYGMNLILFVGKYCGQKWTNDVMFQKLLEKIGHENIKMLLKLDTLTMGEKKTLGNKLKDIAKDTEDVAKLFDISNTIEFKKDEIIINIINSLLYINPNENDMVVNEMDENNLMTFKSVVNEYILNQIGIIEVIDAFFPFKEEYDKTNAIMIKKKQRNSKIDDIIKSYMNDKLTDEMMREIISMMDQQIVLNFRKTIGKYVDGEVDDSTIVAESMVIEEEYIKAYKKLENINNAVKYILKSDNITDEQHQVIMDNIDPALIVGIKMLAKEYLNNQISRTYFTNNSKKVIAQYKSIAKEIFNKSEDPKRIEIQGVIDHFLGSEKYSPKVYNEILARLDNDDMEYISRIVNSYYKSEITLLELLKKTTHIQKKIEGIYAKIALIYDP